jgi:hypothetical protein
MFLSEPKLRTSFVREKRSLRMTKVGFTVLMFFREVTYVISSADY